MPFRFSLTTSCLRVGTGMGFAGALPFLSVGEFMCRHRAERGDSLPGATAGGRSEACPEAPRKVSEKPGPGEASALCSGFIVSFLTVFHFNVFTE